MSNEITKRYSLLTEPWIPVLKTDGETVKYGLIDLFKNVGDIRSLAGDSALQNVTMLRLFMAIVYRSTDPLLSDDWEKYYNNGLPVERITDYLEKNEDRFWLFHPEHPFMQFGGNMVSPAGTFASVTSIMQNGSGDNTLFARKRGAEAEKINLDEAARWLLSTVQYDACGRHTPYLGDPYTKSGASYTTLPYLGSMTTLWVDAGNLTRTILVSCVPLDAGIMTPSVDDNNNLSAGVPSWELEPLPLDAGDVDAFKTTPVQASTILEALTWRGRRVRIFDDGGETVSRVIVSMGLPVRLGDTQGLESMTTWLRTSEKDNSPWKFVPRKFSAEMTSWRGIRSILESGADDDYHTSGNILWIHSLMMDGFLPSNYVANVQLLTVRYDVSMSAAVTDIITDGINVPITLLGENKAGVFDAVDLVNNAGKALGAFVKECAVASGSEQSPHDRQLEFYGELERPFHDWLLDFADDNVTLDDWRHIVEQSALHVMNNAENALPMDAFYGKMIGKKRHSAAKAEIIFRSRLKKL